MAARTTASAEKVRLTPVSMGSVSSRLVDGRTWRTAAANTSAGAEPVVRGMGGSVG
ncbi:hypothetical protein ABH917_003709 [Thermobifida halotolerans]